MHTGTNRHTHTRTPTHTHRMGEASNCPWTLLILFCASALLTLNCLIFCQEIHLCDRIDPRCKLQQWFRSICIFVIISQLHTAVCRLFRCYQILCFFPACVHTSCMRTTWRAALFDIYCSTWCAVKEVWVWQTLYEATALRQKPNTFCCVVFFYFHESFICMFLLVYNQRAKSDSSAFTNTLCYQLVCFIVANFEAYTLAPSVGKCHGCWLK